MSEERWEDPRHIKWSRAIKTKFFFTCVVCGTGGTGGYDVHLESHHMNSYDWAISERFDLLNGSCICAYHHKIFHQKYGYGMNTKAQFNEFLGICKIFRSVLSSESSENSPKEAREIEEILNQEDDQNEGEK